MLIFYNSPLVSFAKSVLYYSMRTENSQARGVLGLAISDQIETGQLKNPNGKWFYPNSDPTEIGQLEDVF